MIQRIGWIMIMTCLLVACQKEQPEMAELNAGCDCAEEVSAEFTISEIFAYGIPDAEFRTITDSCFTTQNIAFYALEEDAQYTWYIGSEKLTEREVVRYFDESWQNAKIPITLVVKKQANTICFPNDDGYDSITKYLYPKTKQYSFDTTYLEGWYRMKGSHLTDSVDIKLDYRGKNNNGTSGNMQLDVYNFDGLGSNIINQNDCRRNFRECFSQGELWGRFKIGMDGLVVFDFSSVTPPLPIQYFYYEGRKL